MRHRFVVSLLLLSSFVLLNMPAWSQKAVPVPPNQLKAPTTTVRLPGSQVNISIVNQTGTEVTYQVLGDTAERRLSTNTTYKLSRLPVPTNMSFYRPDRGPIDAAVQATAPGELQITFRRAANFDHDNTFLTVLDSGQVFLE